jgi:hypothetical protein
LILFKNFCKVIKTKDTKERCKNKLPINVGEVGFVSGWGRVNKYYKDVIE